MCPSGATSLKILKGQSEAYGSRKNSQYNYKKKMVKKNTNNDLQNTRKQKIEQQQKHGVNSGFLKRKAVPAPLMATQRVSPVQKQI